MTFLKRNSTKKLRLLLLPLVVVFFLSAGLWPISAQVSDTSVISMSGSGWSLKVDGVVQTTEVKSVPSVSVAKDGSGAKELSLVLNSLDECKAGNVSFKVDTVGLSCYKQLPLTEKEIEDGAVRPENVVNSYACFDSSGRKVLHIYASKLIDAKGDSVWVDQTLKDGLLTVELNSTWLSSAAFPVILDPTFGYTSIGGSSYNDGAWSLGAGKYTCADTGTLVEVSFYTKADDPAAVKVGVYSDNSGEINALLDESLPVDVDGEMWYNFTVNLAVTASTDYWLAVISNVSRYKFYDTGGVSCYTNTGVSYPTFPDPPSSVSYETQKWSIYGTVNIEGDPTPTPTPTAAPTATPVGTGTAGTMEFIFLIFLILLNFALIIWPRVPILGFIVAIGTFCVVAVIGSNSAGIPYYPLPNVFLAFIALVLLFRSGLAWRAQ